MIRTVKFSNHLALSHFWQPTGCCLIRRQVRRMREPPACPSAEEIPRWQCEIMWVIDKFEEFYFYTAPLISFLSFITSSMRICLCFFTYIQIASSLIPWQAASVSQAGSISDHSPSQNLPMAFWSLDSPPTWQAPDSQGGASGHSSQRPLPPVSHRGWHQGMSFFTRFCSRWNATRIRIMSQIGAGAPFLRFKRISLPNIAQWYHFMTVYSKPAPS